MRAKMLMISAVLLLPALACSQATPAHMKTTDRPSVVATRSTSGPITAAVSRTNLVPSSPEPGEAASTDTPLPAPTVTPTPDAPETHAEVAADLLNLRTGPGTEYAVQRLLRMGERLEVVAKLGDGIWLNVITTDGAEGWVHSDHLLVEDGIIRQLPVAEYAGGITPSSVVEPTRTSLPTSSPTTEPPPTRPPTPGVTPSSGEDTAPYFAEAMAVVESYSNTFSDVTALADAASGNPLLVLSGAWRSQMAEVFAVWESSGERARQLEPPTQLENDHELLLEASQRFDRAAELATQGLSSLDTEMVNEAVTEGLLGYDALNRYAEVLETYLE